MRKHTAHQVRPAGVNVGVVLRARKAAAAGPSLIPVKRRSAPPVPPTARRLTLMDLEPGDCRYPIGDVNKSGFSFCGAQRHQEYPYCNYHYRLCYEPVRQRQARTA